MVNNAVVLIGRLTRDAEPQGLGQDGSMKLRFTLAVDRPGEDQGADFICRSRCTPRMETANDSARTFPSGHRSSL